MLVCREHKKVSSTFFEHGYPIYIIPITLKSSLVILNVHWEGTVSQIFDTGPTFCLIIY